MYRKIIVGWDGSDQCRDAVAFGEQLARATGAKLVLAGVFEVDPLWTGNREDFTDEEVAFARAIETAAAEAGAEAEAFPSSSPARGLHELAEEIGADLILVGSARHGRFGQILAGSTGLSLLHGSPCAVGVAPSGYAGSGREGIATVVAGFDGSPESKRALAAAADLATAAEATLKAVTVAVPPAVNVGRGGAAGWQQLFDAIVEQRRAQLEEALASLPDELDTEATLVTGAAADSLAEIAGEPGALLMVGSRGYGPLRRVLLGSVSGALARWARCPLVVTPRGAEETSQRRSTAAAVAEQLFPGREVAVSTGSSRALVHRSRVPILFVPDGSSGHLDGGPVMLCWDGSEDSRRAIATAGRLFGPRRALVLHLWESWAAEAPALAGASAGVMTVANELDEVADEEAARICARGVRAAEDAGFTAEGFSVKAAGPAWRTVLDAADQQSCAAIVLGSRGLTGLAAALGSLSDAVLDHSRRPVLVIPPEEEKR